MAGLLSTWPSPSIFFRWKITRGGVGSPKVDAKILNINPINLANLDKELRHNTLLLTSGGWHWQEGLTGEQTYAFVPFRMSGENTTVSKRAGHPHFHWPWDGSCHSQELSKLSTKLEVLHGRTIYSLHVIVYILKYILYTFTFQCTDPQGCLCFNSSLQQVVRSSSG